MGDNIKCAPYNDANEVVNELCESLRSKYWDNLETSMRESNFIFDSVQLMYYKCHEVSFKQGDLYFDSLDWIKNKTTINAKNEDDNCFKYAATVALIYEKLSIIQEEFQISNCL